MSWRDEKPAVSYEKAWDATEEVRQVKLTQEYQDGTHKEIKVPIDDGSKGPEYLIMVVMDEFDDAAEELDYTNDELFINFARVLKGNTKFLWQNVTDGLTDAQKTTARFKQAKKELIQAIVGPNQRNIMKSWLQNKCGKPLGVGPLVHLGRIQELIRLTNAFDGTESKIDAAGAKDILLATYPKPWRERYLTSARELSTDSMLDIAQYMNRLWMIEELSGRGRNNNNGKGKKRYRRHDSDGDDDDDNMRNSRRDNGKSGNHSDRYDYYEDNASSRRSNKRRRRVQPEDDCPIHGGGHTWDDCRINPDGPNYKPRRPYEGSRNSEYNNYRNNYDRNYNNNRRKGDEANGMNNGHGKEQRQQTQNNMKSSSERGSYFNNNTDNVPYNNESTQVQQGQHHFDLIGSLLPDNEQ
jgi:hypothetical protein